MLRTAAGTSYASTSASSTATCAETNSAPTACATRSKLGCEYGSRPVSPCARLRLSRRCLLYLVRHRSRRAREPSVGHHSRSQAYRVDDFRIPPPNLSVQRPLHHRRACHRVVRRRLAAYAPIPRPFDLHRLPVHIQRLRHRLVTLLLGPRRRLAERPLHRGVVHRPPTLRLSPRPRLRHRCHHRSHRDAKAIEFLRHLDHHRTHGAASTSVRVFANPRWHDCCPVFNPPSAALGARFLTRLLAQDGIHTQLNLSNAICREHKGREAWGPRRNKSILIDCGPECRPTTR